MSSTNSKNPWTDERFLLTVIVPVVPITIAVFYFFIESQPIKGALEYGIPNNFVRLMSKALLLFSFVFIVLNVLYPPTVLKA